MNEFIDCRFVSSEEGENVGFYCFYLDGPELKFTNVDLSRVPRPRIEVMADGEPIISK